MENEKLSRIARRKKEEEIKNSHFRTWKSGKSWLYTSSSLAFLIAGGAVNSSATFAVTVTPTEVVATSNASTAASSASSSSASQASSLTQQASSLVASNNGKYVAAGGSYTPFELGVRTNSVTINGNGYTVSRLYLW